MSSAFIEPPYVGRKISRWSSSQAIPYFPLARLIIAHASGAPDSPETDIHLNRLLQQCSVALAQETLSDNRFPSPIEPVRGARRRTVKKMFQAALTTLPAIRDCRHFPRTLFLRPLLPAPVRYWYPVTSQKKYKCFKSFHPVPLFAFNLQNLTATVSPASSMLLLCL